MDARHNGHRPATASSMHQYNSAQSLSESDCTALPAIQTVSDDCVAGGADHFTRASQEFRVLKIQDDGQGAAGHLSWAPLRIRVLTVDALGQRVCLGG